MKDITIRRYTEADIPGMVEVWNEIIEEGIAFPQEDGLDEVSGREYFAAQTYCGVAVDEDGKVYGLYTLHPNNIGRCGHIGNSSFAVRSSCRNMHIGEKLVRDCVGRAFENGYPVMQFNAVVRTNENARHLYEKIGFKQLGMIPGGFRMKDGHYEDICLYYIETK